MTFSPCPTEAVSEVRRLVVSNHVLTLVEYLKATICPILLDILFFLFQMGVQILSFPMHEPLETAVVQFYIIC